MIDVNFEITMRLDLWGVTSLRVQPALPVRLTFERSEELVAAAVRHYILGGGCL